MNENCYELDKLTNFIKLFNGIIYGEYISNYYINNLLCNNKKNSNFTKINIIFYSKNELLYFIRILYINFEIYNNNTYINNDLILNNINISEKFKSLIYDLKGPQNINVYYDFYNNSYSSNIILYNSSAPIIIPFSYANIKIIKKNNIIYHTLLDKPFHIFYNFKSYIDVLHFTDIVLKDNTIRNFMNNIKSYTTNNPTININIKFNQDGTTIYPYYIFNISNTTYTVYGLETSII